jgi:hypothetical protein
VRSMREIRQFVCVFQRLIFLLSHASRKSDFVKFGWRWVLVESV